MPPGSIVLRIDPRYFRPTEVESLVGDPTKARERLGWQATTSFEELVDAYVAQVALQDVPDHQRQVPARLHIAPVRHEAHAATGQAAARSGVHPARRGSVAAGVSMAPRGRHLPAPLARHAEVVGRAGGAQADRGGLRALRKPGEHLLIALGLDLLRLGDADPAADRHQQEEVERITPKGDGAVEGLIELVHIVPRHGHVDLYTDAQVAQPAEAGHGLVVMAVAVGASLLASQWAVPSWFELTGAWISIGFLLGLGLLNLYAVLSAAPEQVVALRGIRAQLAR